MLGNVRDREKKITTINLTSHRTKNKVEVKISVVLILINYIEDEKEVFSNWKRTEQFS